MTVQRRAGQALYATAGGAVSRAGILVLTAALLAGAGGACAESWNVTNTLAGWNSGANWAEGAFPNGVGAVAFITNAIAANQTINLNQNITVGSLTIGDGDGTINTRIIQSGVAGSTMTFDAVGSGPAVLTNLNSSGGNGTYFSSLPVQLNDTLEVRVVNNLVTFSGSISGSGGITLVGDSAGTLTMNNSKSYSGSTEIQAGTFNAGGVGSVPGNLLVGGGKLQSLVSEAITNTANVTVNGGSAWFGMLSGGNGTQHVAQLKGSGGVVYGGNDTGRTNVLYVGDSNDFSYSGEIKNSSASKVLQIVKQGAGTWTLDGTADSYGATTIEAGKLLRNDAHTGAGSYLVGSNATLGGTGSVGFASGAGLTVKGTLAPGLPDAIGTLRISNGNVTFDSGGGTPAFRVKVGAAKCDVLQVAGGTVTVGGALQVVDLELQTTNEFKVLTSASGIVGTFGRVTTGWEVEARNSNTELWIQPPPAGLVVTIR